MTQPVPAAAIAPHQPPRRPHAWIAPVVLLHLLVAAAWWQLGWPVGLPLLAALHLLLLWGVLRPSSRMYGPVLTRLRTGARAVWLTIDDGPSDDTAALLDLLDAHGARATFFLVGARAAARPDLVRAIAARGHGIGNHSHTHPQARFWALGPARMWSEVGDCQRALTAITGVAPRWCRAVVGHANPLLHAPLRGHRLARVAWGARGYDAVEADPQVVARRIARDLAPGVIVLLHEGAPHGRSVAAVAEVLALLDAQGYATVVPDAAGDAQATLSASPPPASC